MEAQVLHSPGNSAVKIRLAPGEVCTTEGGAMIAMSGDMQIQTSTHKKGKGGLLRAAKRMLSGESLFLNHYTAGPQGGDLFLAATLPGDMFVYELQQENLIVQGGSYVACEHQVEIDLGWQGFKTAFSGENLFWLHLKGTGKVVVNSFGAIYAVPVEDEFIVDSGHIVAFQETLDFELSKAGKSWVGSFLGGEGLVCKFRGKGTVWCQSHNPPSFGKALGPKLRAR